MQTTKDLDLVVWGATGFTGSLATAYLKGDASKFFSFKLKGAAAPKGLKWAIAGRNRKKLEALESDKEIIICDSEDDAAIERMVKRTKVICGFAGPFVKYSDKLVEYCSKYGTHWVDVTGEIGWHRSLMDRFQDRARATGACIVNHCGFDSIPSDLGAFCAVNALRSRCASKDLQVESITTYQLSIGGLSGGSLQTALAGETHPIELSKGVSVEDPFLLGGVPANGARPSDEKQIKKYYDDELKTWIGPFSMADINTRVVRRSNSLLNYGSSCVYREAMVCFDEKQAARAEVENGPNQAPPSVLQRLIKEGKLPSPGQGPSQELRSKSKFLSTVVAVAGNEKIACTVTGGDCGYEETAKMCIQAGLCLVYESSLCPAVQNGGGFFTPSAGLGTVLLHRLNNAGVNFQVLPETDAVAAARDKILQFKMSLAPKKSKL